MHMWAKQSSDLTLIGTTEAVFIALVVVSVQLICAGMRAAC